MITIAGLSSRRGKGIGLVVGSIVVLGGILAWSGRDPWPPRRLIHLAQPTSTREISRDSRSLVTRGPAQALVYTDLATGQPRQSPPAAKVWAAAYSSDRRTFLGVDFPQDPAAVVWVDTASETIKGRFRTDAGWVNCPSFVDGDRSIRALVWTERQFQAVVTWDIATGTATTRPFRGPDGLSSTKFLLEATPDQRILVFFDRRSNQLQLWDSEADRQIGGLLPGPDRGPSGGLGMAWIPNSRTLLLARAGGQVEVRDLDAPDSVRSYRIHSPGFRTDSIAVSPDGRVLASGGALTNPTTWFGQIGSSLRRSLSSGWDWEATMEVVVIDLASGRQRARLRGAVEPVFSPDGRSFVTRGPRGVYTVRDAPRFVEP